MEIKHNGTAKGLSSSAGFRSVSKPVNVGFILLEHFSLMAFTAACDVLVTANLVHQADAEHYQITSFGLYQDKVVSDLGIEISTAGNIQNIANNFPDILIVCGGFRCSLAEEHRLSLLLRQAHTQGVVLGGIWNGAISLAYAGVLADIAFSLHPDNHALLREQCPLLNLTDKSYQIDSNFLTCAGASSALDMMMQLVTCLQGSAITRAVEEILSCDRFAVRTDLTGSNAVAMSAQNTSLPEHLQTVIQLMNGNIEEPLSIEELASLSDLSRRQVERLFQQHLDVPPSRYYLQLRIRYARDLLLQSRISVTDIAVACGFVSSSHFSNCFKNFFGLAPTDFREQQLHRKA